MNVSTISFFPKLGLASIAAISGLSPPFLPQRAEPETTSEIPYVAFGDSLTTGSSVETCRENRQRSPWGCSESPTAAVPYPNRVAQSLGYRFSNKISDYVPEQFEKRSLDLYRAGTWGYTIQEAASAHQASQNNGWLPQLSAISRATRLVTGSLGINDLHFSDVATWAKLYLRPGGDHITPRVRQKIAERTADFDELFRVLRDARDRGVNVVISLYYNPYDVDDNACADLRTIGNRIVNTLDDELQERAHQEGFDVADFRRSFQGHGSGSRDSYVFGTECKLSSAIVAVLPKWMGGGGGTRALAVRFDPHPNNKGTAAMAQAIMEEFNNAD